jgi:prepilin-type processing-associated H-X9-DG protein
MLVVVTIIILLFSLIFPAVRMAMNKSKGAKCASNLRQFYMAAENYSMDNDGQSLPGSNWGNSDFWMYVLRPYLGGTSNWDDSVDDLVRCPGYTKGSNYWAWGYGMNSRPGFVGTATSSYEDDFNWGGGSGWMRTFASITITHKSKRLFICDSKEWQVVPAGSASGVAAFPDYHRHGKDACNVLFYDGHVESLKSASINQALYDPAKR